MTKATLKLKEFVSYLQGNTGKFRQRSLSVSSSLTVGDTSYHSRCVLSLPSDNALYALNVDCLPTSLAAHPIVLKVSKALEEGLSRIYST